MHPSVDQLIAKQLAAKTRFPSLEFGIRPVGGDVPCIVNFAMDGSPLPRMADDKAAFTRVFSGLTGSPTTPGMPIGTDPAGRSPISFTAASSADAHAGRRGPAHAGWAPAVPARAGGPHRQQHTAAGRLCGQ